jgi:hypothetical protein
VQSPATNKTNNNVALAATTNQKIEGLYYCWTHGLGYNKDYTSTNCNLASEGHRAEATVFIMLGGNNCIRRQKAELQNFTPKPHEGTLVALQ